MATGFHLALTAGVRPLGLANLYSRHLTPVFYYNVSAEFVNPIAFSRELRKKRGAPGFEILIRIRDWRSLGAPKPKPLGFG